MVEKARQGKMLYTLPELGYTWTSTNPTTGRKAPGAEPRVRAEDVPIVQLIFERVEQMSLRRVALGITEEGHRFRSRDGHQLTFLARGCLSVVGIGIMRVADGKIAEFRGNPDVMGLMQQIGAVPAPGQG